MAFFARCISGNSLRGMVRGDAEDDPAGTSGETTPNDTAHGGNKFGSSWKRLSKSSRSSLKESPKKPHTPPTSLASGEGVGVSRASMEPVMERTRSALTDLEAVKFLVEDWSHKHWRPATPQDQERFERIDQKDIKPLVALGEGAYGSVNLCRIPARRTSASGVHDSQHQASARTASATGTSPFGTRNAQSQRDLTATSMPLAPSGSGRVGGSEGALDRTCQAGASGGTATSNSNSARSSLSGAVQQQQQQRGSGGGGTGSGVGNPVGLPPRSRPPSNSGAPAAGEDSLAVVAGSAEDLCASTSACAFPAGSSPTALSSSSAASASTGAGGIGAGGSTLGGGAAAGAFSHAFASASAAAPDGAGAGAGPSTTASTSTMQPTSSVNDPQLIVAVKRVPLGWNQERELMQLHRCQQCPFIVRLFGFVEDGEEHCSYVMEWAEGGDLAGMLASLKDRRGGSKQRLLMSEASARYYCGCLLLALEFLHANGLLHRDIKPSNLLLTSDGTAKLADLGFTVALDANGQTVGCCGTTGYIAPEVYAYGSAKSRKEYGIPADVWSSGATLYQVLTGSVVTDHPEEVLKKGWRPPAHPRFSQQLQDLLNRMLAAKPRDRPQSVASVMRHAWFAGFDWAALRAGRLKAPYVPSERRRMRQVAEDVMGTGGPSSSGGGLGVDLFGLGGGSSGGPPPASPGGARLATVLERVPSGLPPPAAAGGAEGGGGGSGSGSGSVVQRSALSGRGEGSVRQGRDGMVREGSSFDTALDTVTPPEASASAAAAALASGGSGVGTPHAGGHGRPHGHVRFAVGVAECA